MYDCWNIVRVTNVIISQFGLFFVLLTPKSPKNWNFEKMKKIPGNIVILHMCTKNYDQKMYSSWDMMCDRCNCYFSFWSIFCFFTPLKSPKIEILKMKKHLEISSLCIRVPNVMIRWCTVPKIWCATYGRTGGRKKWHIEVGAPPKNKKRRIPISISPQPI